MIYMINNFITKQTKQWRIFFRLSLMLYLTIILLYIFCLKTIFKISDIGLYSGIVFGACIIMPILLVTIKVLRSIKNSWEEKGRFWRIFWLWGPLIYVPALPIGMLAFGLHHMYFNIYTRIFALTVGLFGQIFTFIYPVIFCTALKKNHTNPSGNLSLRFQKFFPSFYFAIHIVLGLISLLGGILLIGLSMTTQKF